MASGIERRAPQEAGLGAAQPEAGQASKRPEVREGGRGFPRGLQGRQVQVQVQVRRPGAAAGERHRRRGLLSAEAGSIAHGSQRRIRPVRDPAFLVGRLESKPGQGSPEPLQGPVSRPDVRRRHDEVVHPPEVPAALPSHRSVHRREHGVGQDRGRRRADGQPRHTRGLPPVQEPGQAGDHGVAGARSLQAFQDDVTGDASVAVPHVRHRHRPRPGRQQALDTVAPSGPGPTERLQPQAAPLGEPPVGPVRHDGGRQ